MSRLGKKCFFASALVHLAMLAVLLFGSAFLVPADKAPAFTPIKVYTLATLTDALSRGGSPNVKAAPAPAARPPAPQPAPQPAPTPAPVQPRAEPRPQPVRHEARALPQPVEPPVHKAVIKRRTPPVHRVEIPTPVEPFFPEPVKEKKPKVVLDDDDLKPVKVSGAKVKPPAAKPRPKPVVVESEAEAQAEAQAAADNRRRVEAFREIARNIGSGLSASAPVEISGPGNDGPAMQNYAQVIFSKYYEAWIVPPGLDDEKATVLVSVTIASDGQVVSARIIENSGNRLLDRSIQSTIERVTFLAPFPEGAKSQPRTFKLQFNPQAKRALG